MSLFSAGITVYCGVYYLAAADGSVALTNEASLMLFSMIVIVNMLFFGYWTYEFLKELRITIRKKVPRIYECLFLCCNKKKF